jgi:AmmeMemoRadiSam system protein B
MGIDYASLWSVATSSARPRLRDVESIVVHDPTHGRVCVLRDSEGIAESPAVVPLKLVPVLARFTGNATCAAIAHDLDVPVHVVTHVASELARGLFLHGPTFERAKKRAEQAFADATVRAASHAGGAYFADADKLAHYIDTKCLALATLATARPKGRLLGLVAPHIDPWRGACSYGHAYEALRRWVSPNTTRFVLLGTSHAPMRAPFALCRKAYATPFGALDVDDEAMQQLVQASDFDPFDGEFLHKREHSLEFQAVFLRHVLGSRKASIVPILAGLSEAQASGQSPSDTPNVERFLDALRAIAGRDDTLILAGADLAHVGPRFGDARAHDEAGRATLGETDRESLARAARGDAEAFWDHVAEDLDTRRVCGLAPIYSLLRALPAGTRGKLWHYEQTVAPDEGSIASHGALGFFG